MKRLADNQVAWYVMRTVACGCNKSIAAALKEGGVSYFQPMHYVPRKRAGKVVKSLEPLISNIFFVHSSKEELLPYTQGGCKHFQFYYDRCSGKQADCLYVPDKQMDDFRLVYEQTAENPQIFTPEELQLTPGQRVRILGGELHGVEGRFERLKGRRSRSLIVTIDGLMSITATVKPELVELVKE